MREYRNMTRVVKNDDKHFRVLSQFSMSFRLWIFAIHVSCSVAQLVVPRSRFVTCQSNFCGFWAVLIKAIYSFFVIGGIFHLVSARLIV